MKRVFLMLILVFLLLGCVQDQSQEGDNLPDSNSDDSGNGGDDKMGVVENGDTVNVEYIGKFPDTGEVFDKSEGRGPLEFVAGAGQMIKGFDAAVLGMKLNEEKTVQIAPEDAYGTADSGQKMDVPVEQIGDANSVQVGTKVYASSGQEWTVVEINEGIAIVEFIHPLAGKTLEFWIKVVEINKN